MAARNACAGIACGKRRSRFQATRYLKTASRRHCEELLDLWNSGPGNGAYARRGLVTSCIPDWCTTTRHQRVSHQFSSRSPCIQRSFAQEALCTAPAKQRLSWWSSCRWWRLSICFQHSRVQLTRLRKQGPQRRATRFSWLPPKFQDNSRTRPFGSASCFSNHTHLPSSRECAWSIRVFAAANRTRIPLPRSDCPYGQERRRFPPSKKPSR